LVITILLTYHKMILIMDIAGLFFWDYINFDYFCLPPSRIPAQGPSSLPLGLGPTIIQATLQDGHQVHEDLAETMRGIDGSARTSIYIY
jgi:hypothetical protein